MDRPLVTQVCWTLGRAGAERMVLDLARHLPSRGFDVRVISAFRAGDMLKDFRDAGIPVAVGPETRDRRQTMAFLKQELTANRPSVLHTHLGADIWAGMVARRLRIRPWIITAHSDVSYDRWLVRRLHRWAYRRADRVACVSKAVLDHVRHDFGTRESRLSVIPNGIDAGLFTPRGSGSFQDVPRLITVGRLVEGKDLPTLFRALSAIKRPWHLDVCGDGPMRAPWERLAERLGILPRVQFRGVCQDIASDYARADLLCFPTRHEGQGLALYEASAAGVPSIASDLPVFREAFDGQSVTFVRTGDVRAWTDAIDLALSDPRTSLDKAVRAQSIVRERYSVEKMVYGYAEMYRETGSL